MGGAHAFLAEIIHYLFSNVGGQFYHGCVVAVDIQYPAAQLSGRYYRRPDGPARLGIFKAH